MGETLWSGHLVEEAGELAADGADLKCELTVVSQKGWAWREGVDI